MGIKLVLFNTPGDAGGTIAVMFGRAAKRAVVFEIVYRVRTNNPNDGVRIGETLDKINIYSEARDEERCRTADRLRSRVSI